MKKMIPAIICLMLCTGCVGTPDGQTVEIEQTPPAQSQSESAPQEVQPQTASDTTIGTEPESEEEVKLLPLEGHTICIDPGHCITPELGKGGRERVSPLSDETKLMFGGGTAGKHQTEEKLNLLVGMKLRDRLAGLGVETVMTREVSEITLSNIERCEIANSSGADVCIRLHADGVDDSSVHGVSVLVPAGELLGTPEIIEDSARLGALMVDAVAETTGAKNRGTVNRSDLTGFNFSEIPTVLIEMGFMTNPEEDALLETDEYQDKIVDGIVTSLLSWYSVNVQP